MKLIDGQRFSTVTETGIYGFFNTYRFLSNFHVAPLTVDGLTYGSSEAAYMAQKSHNEPIRIALTTMAPREARNFGQTIPLREDWEAYKVLAMTKVLLAKFSQNDELKQMLKDTGNKYLEETNNWGDRFWGVDGKGHNMLGHCLMFIRENC